MSEYSLPKESYCWAILVLCYIVELFCVVLEASKDKIHGYSSMSVEVPMYLHNTFVVL